MKHFQFSRREMLQIGGAALCAATLPQAAGAITSKPKKILYFTKSSGFQHSVVKRTDGELSYSEKILIDLGKKHGFDVTASKDGRIFDGDHEAYDGYVFYTSGDLTKVGPEDHSPAMSERGKQALLDAVKGGKAFIGIHAATDTFRSPGNKVDPYIAMLGGEFISHGAQQKARMTVVSPDFPGFGGLGRSFEMLEEWYALKKFAPDLHVLLVQETEGMKGEQYQRPPFPATWAHMHGDGRVFYTSLGHREDVWTSDVFQQIIVGALNWATGLASAKIPPNMAQVTPGANAKG